MSKLYRTVHLPRKAHCIRPSFSFCPKCGRPFHGRGVCRHCRKAEHIKRGEGTRHV